MPNINEAFPSNYLKASDLQGQDALLTIAKVDFEDVGRDKERKPVVYFKGKQKGLVLNKTNARKITEVLGTAITEEWKGGQIKLYPTETEFAGETVECIRVKAVGRQAMRMQPDPPLPPPSHDGPLDDSDIPF